MPPAALVLLSALSHASWNALLKGRRDPAAASAWIVLGAALASGLLAVLSGRAAIPAGAWPATVASGVVEAAYFVLLSAAMARLPLGTAYGVSRGAGLLLTWPLSVALLGEVPGAAHVLGSMAVAGGLFVMVGRGGFDGLGWALGCAAAIGAYPLAYQAALRAGAPDYALFATSLAVSWPFQVGLLGPARRARLAGTAGERPGELLVAAGLCAVSFLLFLAALSRAGAGWAAAMRNTSVVFATLLGWARGEPRTGRGIASALLIAAGAAILAG